MLLSACATTQVRIDVHAGRSGSGTVDVVVSVPASTARLVPDLAHGLPVSDLQAAGWHVASPVTAPGGSVVVSAEHAFSSLYQVPALMADLAGQGPSSRRPFQLRIAESHAPLRTSYTVDAHFDLRCGLSCFADPALARSVGYAMGLPPSELHRVLGPHPDRDMAFTVKVTVPGKPSGKPGPGSGKVTRIWSVPLGSVRSGHFRTEVVDTAALRRIVIGSSAASLVVLVTAAVLVVRHRRTTRRRRRRSVTSYYLR